MREADSPDLPFDIATERMLHVHRDDRGNLDRDALAEALHGSLAALVETPDTNS